jgi:hypothetical protein
MSKVNVLLALLRPPNVANYMAHGYCRNEDSEARLALRMPLTSSRKQRRDSHRSYSWTVLQLQLLRQTRRQGDIARSFSSVGPPYRILLVGRSYRGETAII